MDPVIVRLNNEYNAYNNLFNHYNVPQAAAPSAPAPVPYNVQQPNAILLPAPEERPFPATYFVDKELWLCRVQGAVVTVVVFMLVILKGWPRVAILAGIATWFVYLYIRWQADVAKAKMNEKAWMDKIIPTPPPQHYVVQQIM